MISFYKVIVLLSALFTGLCFAQSSKVLIVNTDANIPYYNEIASEFKKALPKNTYALVEFDLKTHNNPEYELQELIQNTQPKFIYCIGSLACLSSKNYSVNQFLILSGAINWEKLELNNETYGISNELEPEQEITLLRIFFPDIKKIGILYSEKNNAEYLMKIKQASHIFNIEIVAVPIDETDEVNSALTELLPNIDLLWLIADPLVLGSDDKSTTEILQLSKQQHKPVYVYKDVYIKSGAALSISADATTIAQQAVELVNSLQNGKIPHPQIQFPAGSHITLNKCVFDTLKIPVRKESLSAIDKIVSCSSP
jgi:putative tryptophan/tyrosine transport system substrate-binding protein